MNVINNTERTVSFGDISCGGAFRFPDSMTVFMRTRRVRDYSSSKEYNAVDICDGSMHLFTDIAPVVALLAEVSIKRCGL